MEKAEFQRQALRLDAALVTLDRALAMEPEHGQALMLKAVTAWDLARWDIARETLSLAAGISGTEARARQALAVLEDLKPRELDLQNP